MCVSCVHTKQPLHFWAHALRYMNMVSVLIQILLPCSAPWCELVHGLTLANYSMKGSPGGLACTNTLFHSNIYTITFTNVPIPFGAFPSLHAGCVTIEALSLCHFIPATTKYVYAYTSVLYWAMMYLSHQYLINVIGGVCHATAFFYLFLPDNLRDSTALIPPPNLEDFTLPHIFHVESMWSQVGVQLLHLDNMNSTSEHRQLN